MSFSSVVPQEYGISIEEKRHIGSKMCDTLLEKINYDLGVAREDDQGDMRYLINMDYSADLPINSMGRRVRTRLYFTSESHLHSLLNVLRFPSARKGCVPSPLSHNGQHILADSSELCYLTQVVIRLFEDINKHKDDPKRFRVEILFSPGATATPLHMAEMHRDNDATRFETEKLQMVSIDGLTCAQVEEYFAEAINEGKSKRDEKSPQSEVAKVCSLTRDTIPLLEGRVVDMKVSKSGGKLQQGAGPDKSLPKRSLSSFSTEMRSSKLNVSLVAASDEDDDSIKSYGDLETRASDRLFGRFYSDLSDIILSTKHRIDGRFLSSCCGRGAAVFVCALGLGCVVLINRAAKGSMRP